MMNRVSPVKNIRTEANGMLIGLPFFLEIMIGFSVKTFGSACQTNSGSAFVMYKGWASPSTKISMSKTLGSCETVSRLCGSLIVIGSSANQRPHPNLIFLTSSLMG